VPLFLLTVPFPVRARDMATLSRDLIRNERTAVVLKSAGWHMRDRSTLRFLFMFSACLKRGGDFVFDEEDDDVAVALCPCC
jgi:hypothetical protein